jgi:hypothetical protein
MTSVPWRERNLLAHPLVWGCVVLTALNDHVLKSAYPGHLTGKISDFAGLFFFPVLAAEVIVRLFPSSTPAYVDLARAAALSGGALFTAAKLSHEFRDVLVEVVGSFGLAIRVVCDPSDLVALAALPAACLFALRRNIHES